MSGCFLCGREVIRTGWQRLTRPGDVCLPADEESCSVRYHADVLRGPA